MLKLFRRKSAGTATTNRKGTTSGPDSLAGNEGGQDGRNYLVDSEGDRLAERSIKIARRSALT